MNFQWYGIQVLTGSALKSIEGNTVTLKAKDETETVLDADAIVIAVGLSANDKLKEQLDNETEIEVYPVGDCNRPRKIYDAIHEGYTAAIQI